MCPSENETSSWRRTTQDVAIIETVWGFTGAVFMIACLCFYFEAKARPLPSNGTYQGIQGVPGLALSIGKPSIILFLVIHLLVALLGILLLVATRDSLVKSKPKRCYRMVCTWIISGLANSIFNFISIVMFAGGVAAFLPIIVLLAQAFLCFPLPFYASDLYKKMHRPYETMLVTRFGNTREYPDAAAPEQACRCLVMHAGGSFDTFNDEKFL